MSKTSAKIIADTKNPYNLDARITTFEVYAPRFLLAEVNTHGVLAKSAASSRAIPVLKRVDMIRDHGFIPSAFGKNKAGMQAAEYLDENKAPTAFAIWKKAMSAAMEYATELQHIEVHKQHANRILEPFAYYHGVITGTEWDNFYKLRLHPDAQPEFRELAEKMKEAYDASVARVDEFHMPYVSEEEQASTNLADAFMVSSARCARVSYKTFDGRVSTLSEDLELCKKLIDGGHMSPFDHPASCDTVRKEDDDSYVWQNPDMHRRFWGWISERAVMEDNMGIQSRRDPYAPFKVINHDL